MINTASGIPNLAATSIDQSAHLGIKSFLRVAVSFSTKKLDESIQEIETNVDNIDKLVPIIEARRARGEQEDARRERVEAGIERLEARVERQAQREFRDMYQDDRYSTYQLAFFNFKSP